MISEHRENVRLRISILGIALVFFLVAIGARAAYLQVYCDDWLSGKAAEGYKKFLTSRGKRGSIYDSSHRKLAVAVDVTSVAAYPAKIQDVEETAAILVGALNVDEEVLISRLMSEKAFVWIKRQIPPKEALAVRRLGLEGIDFIPEHHRFYPHKTSAAQVIGFCGIDGRGLEGIEFYYENYLKGKEKTFTVLKDALGREFEGEDKRFTNSGGDNLVLTIDLTIQYLTEKALEGAVTKFSANSGMAIVMSPKTGAVLALAHFPGFNPNSFHDFNKVFWRNRAITDPFEPGSVMKIFSAAAAIESGKYTANSQFYCEKGQYRIGSNIIHDTKKHGWLSLQEIVQVSSNIGAVKISENIGQKSLYEFLVDFGFGKRSRIDCPGESPGKLRYYKKWAKIDAGTIAFGHGMSATALQTAIATCAIANNGILMKPYIVQAITDENGRLIKSFGPEVIKRVISSGTARSVMQMMQSVTSEGGTGMNAALNGYTSCGKTGTAQKIDENGEYSQEKYIASFIGFAPAEDPEVVILVVVDEPEKRHHGGAVAAPAFKKIAQETLNYMDLPPGKSNTKRLVAFEVNSG